MKAVVTGGAGFIGSHLARELVSQGHQVKSVDIKLDPRLDVRDRETLRNEFAGSEVIFHLAALPSVPYSIDHPAETHDTNLTGTLNVLMAAREVGARRVVFSSSAAVYGDQEHLPVREDAEKRPMSPYALHKLEGEEYLRLFSLVYGLETVSLRYFNVYGVGQDPHGPYASAIPAFLRMKSEGKPIRVIGDGDQTRDFVHVSDVVAANMSAATGAKVGRGESLNIATGRAVSMNYIAKLIGGPIEHLPPRLEIRDSVANITLAKKLLDWEPRMSLEEGIQELVEKLP